jgi:hypothetical protein
MRLEVLARINRRLESSAAAYYCPFDLEAFTGQESHHSHIQRVEPQLICQILFARNLTRLALPGVSAEAMEANS